MYDESETIDLDTVPLEGGVLLKMLSFSIDPYLRHRMIKPEGPQYEETVVSSTSSSLSAPSLTPPLLRNLWRRVNCKHTPHNNVILELIFAIRMENNGVAVVLRSADPAFQPGDHLWDMFRTS